MSQFARDASPKRDRSASVAQGRGSASAHSQTPVSNRQMSAQLHGLTTDVRISTPESAVEADAERMAEAALSDNASAGERSSRFAASTRRPNPLGTQPFAAGQPLSDRQRAYFEPRFGADLSSVRLHHDAAAADAAAAVHARAYTRGSHIVFGAGEYAPTSVEGKRLLAHEIAHTLQRDTNAGQEIRRVPWTVTRADERATTGGDRFDAQTFELTISSLAGLAGRTFNESIRVSVFVPSGVVAGRNKVHVFFGPGGAAESTVDPATGAVSPVPTGTEGLNAAMTHGFRGTSNTTEWITISVPGRSGANSESNGFNTIDAAAIRTCLTAAGRSTNGIDALRFSSHSRGSRGLRETLNRKLIPSPVAERVVVFDAAFSSLDSALSRSGIAGANMVALNVIDPGRLSVAGARNLSLNAAAMRAIGYSRIIADARVVRPSLTIPADIATQLLTLPSRGSFTTASPAPAGMTNINDFATTQKTAIATIVANENHPTKGLKTFIDDNNLIGLGQAFSSAIYSHHLFVAELAHEVTN